MIAALTYAWLSGRVQVAPYAYEASRAVKRYGFPAVFGDRQATARELREMTIAEDIVSAWVSASRAEDLAKWAGANKSQSDLLSYARQVSESIYGAD